MLIEISYAIKSHDISKVIEEIEGIGIEISRKGGADSSSPGGVGEPTGRFPRKIEINISMRNVQTDTMTFEYLFSERTAAWPQQELQKAANKWAEELKKKFFESVPTCNVSTCNVQLSENA